MPLVNISILKGKSPEFIRAVADAVNSAVIETMGFPHDDRYQIIHEHFRADHWPEAPSFGTFWRLGRVRAKRGARRRALNRIVSGIGWVQAIWDRSNGRAGGSGWCPFCVRTNGGRTAVVRVVKYVGGSEENLEMSYTT